jgi:hypothetical protein
MTAPLGPAGPVEAVLDTTGRNTGNYTATFDSSVLDFNLPLFECYHIVIDGPVGSSFDLYVGNQWYSSVAQGWKNEWDPSQTMKLQQGQVIYFFWNISPSANVTPVPVVTMYFQEPSPV